MSSRFLVFVPDHEMLHVFGKVEILQMRGKGGGNGGKALLLSALHFSQLVARPLTTCSHLCFHIARLEREIARSLVHYRKSIENQLMIPLFSLTIYIINFLNKFLTGLVLGCQIYGRKIPCWCSQISKVQSCSH